MSAWRVAGSALSARRPATRKPTRCRSNRFGTPAGEGWTEAVTEFHIVGGLHPELTLDWYCEMLRGLKERFPQVHLKAFTMVEIAYLAQREKIADPGSLAAAERRGHGFDARRRRGDLLAIACGASSAITRSTDGVARDCAHGA